MDKFEQTGLKKGEAKKINAPVIEDSPVNIECRVREEVALGSHTMFIADVVHVTVDDAYMDEKGTFHLENKTEVSYVFDKEEIEALARNNASPGNIMIQGAVCM